MRYGRIKPFSRALAALALLGLPLSLQSAWAQDVVGPNVRADQSATGGIPYFTLQTTMSSGGKAGLTQHHFFGPYNSTSADPGALYIGIGQSPTGGRNNLFLQLRLRRWYV